MNRISSILTLLIVSFLTDSLCSQTVLLIPDSVNSRVAAFSAFDGSVIDLNFISPDGTLDTPLNVIDSGRGTIFVSDDDFIFEYGQDGNFIGTFAGPNQGLSNVTGIAVNGSSLFANVTGGPDSVQEFDLVTGVQSTWATENLNSIQDITFRSNDVLISNFFTDNVERYDLDGNFLSTFADGDGINSIDFPQQIHETANGDILVGGLLNPQGIYRYDSLGDLISVDDVGLGIRGVYELENGNILYSTVLGVLSFDPTTDSSLLITNDLEGVWGYIEPVTVSVPEPTSFTLLLLGSPLLLLRRKRFWKQHTAICMTRSSVACMERNAEALRTQRS